MKKLFVAALAAMTLFASCAKDDAKNNGEDGVETKMGLTLTFPNSSGTRTLDPVSPTTQEMNVKNITVFLYGTGGDPVLGNMTVLALDAFDKSGHVYTLKHDKRITTTTGVKSIYVGVNLTDSDFMTGITAATNESELNTIYSTTIANLTKIDGAPAAGNFVMFSTQVERKELVAESDPNWFTNNTVNVNVERQIAKMTADAAASLTKWEGGSYGEHVMKGYYLGQAGKGKMYRNPVTNLEGKRLTTIERTNLGYTHLFKSLNSGTLALNATTRTSFFGIENVPLNNLRKETTVAVFYAQFTPKNLTRKSMGYDRYMGELNRDAAWEDVDWVAIAAPIENVLKDPNDASKGTRTIEPGSFWMVKKGTDFKFFNDQAEALDYVRDFNLAGATQPPITGTTLYQKGNTFFYQYLGDVSTTPYTYEFARNQYYHLQVTGFGGLGYPGTTDPQDPPGVDPTDPGTDPKDPTDPTDPIDPGEPTPTVPDPTEPTPGNEDETSLRVQVTVLPWDVKVMDGLILKPE